MHVLFVCTGNICRSPMAHGIFNHLLQTENLSEFFIVDSAGTHGWDNKLPDIFARTVASARGINLEKLRSRKLTRFDLETADIVLLADNYNREYIESSFRNTGNLRLLTEFSAQPGLSDIPDPYGAGMHEFEKAFELIYECCNGLLNWSRKKINARGK